MGKNKILYFYILLVLLILIAWISFVVSKSNWYIIYKITRLEQKKEKLIQKITDENYNSIENEIKELSIKQYNIINKNSFIKDNTINISLINTSISDYLQDKGIKEYITNDIKTIPNNNSYSTYFSSPLPIENNDTINSPENEWIKDTTINDYQEQIVTIPTGIFPPTSTTNNSVESSPYFSSSQSEEVNNWNQEQIFINQSVNFPKTTDPIVTDQPMQYFSSVQSDGENNWNQEQIFINQSVNFSPIN